METFFIKMFWITVIMLWAALIILYFILTNKKSLERKGHQEKYIAYLRKSHRIRIILIALLMPLLILLAGWIISKITGPLTDEVQIAYIVVALVVLVVPFKFVDEYINQLRIRQLALETHERVAVDLKYQTLHLIFNPFWECLLAVAATLYGIFYLKIDQWIIYLFIAIPWFLYLNVRSTRYQTRPYLQDNYKYMFSFAIYSFLFFLVYFDAYYLKRLQEFSSDSSLVWTLAGFLIVLGLVGRIALYLANYREFNHSLAGRSDAPGTPVTRKIVFLACGFFLLFSLSGLAMLTGLVKSRNLEVGCVSEKYLIHDYQGHSDTVLIISPYSDPASLREYFEHEYPGEIRMECCLTLSTSQKVKTYEICCPSIFRDLPVGDIVKFKYSSRSITGLVAY
jgi:hypothetical protein